MIIDGSLLFTGTSNGATSTVANASYTDLPTTGTQFSSNYIDLGVKSGVPASSSGGGARDIGIGDKPSLKLLIEVTTAITGGTDLTVSLIGGIDDGSGGITWGTTMWTSPTISEASLIAGTYIANIDIPRPVPGQALPRFLRLGYVSNGTHTAGALWGAIVVDRFDETVGTGGALSGYPAGVTVPN